MTTIQDIPRPTNGDVVELILADHRLFESLLRELRDDTSDREAARQAFAELHVAHALSEESEVYPRLERKDAISDHEEEHGREEHAEGHEALLALLECVGTNTQKFEDALEELATAVNHHLAEEETSILNPARSEVSEADRRALGERWLAARNEKLAQGCASVEQVRAIVKKAYGEDLLPADDEE